MSSIWGSGIIRIKIILNNFSRLPPLGEDMMDLVGYYEEGGSGDVGQAGCTFEYAPTPDE